MPKKKRTPRATANSCTPHLTSTSKPLKRLWSGAYFRCYSHQTLFWGEAWAPMEGASLHKQETRFEAKTKPPPPHKPTKTSTNNPAGPLAGRGSGLASASRLRPLPRPVRTSAPSTPAVRAKSRAPSALHLCFHHRNSPKEMDASAPPGVATTAAAGGPEAGRTRADGGPLGLTSWAVGLDA